MYICTYKLPGREKIFREIRSRPAIQMFIKDYAEVMGQVKKVKIEKTTILILSYGS